MSARTTTPWNVERFELSMTALNLCTVTIHTKAARFCHKRKSFHMEQNM